jgi:alkylation response protein AidB-like acyl-CoA dehydrogenase
MSAIFLSRERKCLNALLPGLDERLHARTPTELESRGSSVLRDFATAGGAGLLVPSELGGLGATAVQAADVLRALGTRSASLAVGTCMHHYKVAWLAETLDGDRRKTVLSTIARERLLVASCGAESRRADGVFNPGIGVRAQGEGLVVSGVKRPCSLVWDMGILSMLIRAPDGSPHAGQLAILLIDATHPQLHRRELWRNPVLAGAQTDEIELEDVFVPAEGIIPIGTDTSGDGASANLIWFQVLITAAYLGVASGLVEAAVETCGTEAVLDAITQLEAAHLAVRGLAHQVDDGERGQGALADGIICRIAAQRAVRAATNQALRVLDVEARPDHFSAATASRAMAFHPGGPRDGAAPLLTYYTGGPLALA